MIFARDEVNQTLKDGSLWIALGCVAAVLLIALCIILFNYFRHKKVQNLKKENTVDEFYNLVGGIENVEQISLKGSRLALKLKNSAALDKEAIKNLGVLNIIETKEKITFVLSEEAKDYFSKINTNI